MVGEGATAVIQDITADECLPIRQKVLWPDRDLDHSRVPGDDQGLHFGACVDGTLVSVASVFVKDNEARLRKFAILEDHQGQGIGSQMLTHVMAQMKAQGATKLWCDARETAITFYTRFGFSVEGERFFKHEVPYVKMVVGL
ncbi:GNAT family N-acetyltransferase [Pseudomonadota bacterium]